MSGKSSGTQGGVQSLPRPVAYRLYYNADLSTRFLSALSAGRTDQQGGFMRRTSECLGTNCMWCACVYDREGFEKRHKKNYTRRSRRRRRKRLLPNNLDTSSASTSRPPGTALAAARFAAGLMSLFALCRSPILAMFVSAVKLLSHSS